MPLLPPNVSYRPDNTPLFALPGAAGGGQTLSLAGNTIALSGGGGSINVANATTLASVDAKTTAQSYVSGFDSTRFTGEIIAGGNIESAPTFGGSAVLNGGDSEVTIGGTALLNPKVRFEVPSQPEGVIEYNGTAFSFNPPLPAGGAPGGANQDIQFNNSGAFGGDAGLTYNSSGRIVRLTNADGDSRIEVFDPTNSNKVEVKSNKIILKPSDFEAIQINGGDPNGSYINLRQQTNTSNVTYIDTTRVNVASATARTIHIPSSFDFEEYDSGLGGYVAKAGLAYASATGAVGLSSVNSGEVFLARTDGSLAESVIGLKADNTYAFGDINTEDNCVLQLNKGAAAASITYDGSAFAFNPPLPAGGVPAGADTQLQFNNAGAFGASSNLTFVGDLLQVVGAIDISGATPNLNMADLSGNSFSVALNSTPQPTVVFNGQAGAGMTMTPDGVVYNDSTTNVVTIDAVTPFVQVTNGTEASALHAGYVSATLQPLLPDQLTRKDYVDAAVAGASGATPYTIYCSATAAPGGDGSFALPYNSITDAITAAVAGSVIYLYGTFPMTTTTITKSNFTLKALGQAVIQNTSLTPPTGSPKGWWQTNGGTSNITFDGITFQSTVQPNSELNFLTLLGSNHVVRNCVFAGVSSYDAFNPGAVTTRGLQVSGGVVNLLVEDCEFYNLRQPVYTNAGSGSFLRNSVTNTRGAVNSSAGNFFQYTANVFGQNVLDIVILTGVQTGAPYADLYQLSADNNFAVVQDQRVTPNITIQATIPINVSYATSFPLGTTAQPYFTYFLNSSLGGSIALPSTTNANGQWISFNNVPLLPNAGTLTITSSSANIYDGGTLNTAVVLTAGQQKKFLFSSAANAWLPFV